MRFLLIFLALVVVTEASAADRLVTRYSREAGFVVRVPADWLYRNASYPSDHSTELWTSPADKASRLKVEVSGCVGCVEPRSCVLENKGCRPAPENIVPARA